MTEKTEHGFCPVSLGDWLKACAAADIPAIAAFEVAAIRKDDYLHWDEEGEHVERLVRAYSQVRKTSEEGYVMRYDCCCSSEVKSRLGSGMPEWHEDFGWLTVDDPRAYAMIEEYPREMVPIWKRPWVAARVVDGYPVEYRVFVREGVIAGISSYYPQRELPLFREHLEMVKHYTLNLIGEVKKSAPFQWHTGYLFQMGRYRLDLDKVSFTVDYLVDKHEEVLFLEGGPPYELGADSCCFEDGRISGVALKNRNE